MVGDIPALNCNFADGALRAQMGFNMATAIITLIADDAELAQRGGAGSCEIDLLNNSGGDATLRFIYASRVDPDAPEARLTTDYNLTITLDSSSPVVQAKAARAKFVADIAAGDIDWFSASAIVGSGTSLDWDGDGIENRYDWTPTSVAIVEGGPLIEVNLTVSGADGSAANPWPIYNVWQLQAIDGMSVSDDGEISEGFALFGDESARLEANYRLAMDIDATPTRAWDSGKGFNPIGLFIIDPDLNTIIENFMGVFDGGGNVVRGLRINRAGFFNGLFSYVSGSIIGLGLDDVFVGGGSGGDSGFGSGALAGRLILGGVCARIMGARRGRKQCRRGRLDWRAWQRCGWGWNSFRELVCGSD